MDLFLAIVEDNRLSRADQIMRVANATRRGGDLQSAMALYHRAHWRNDDVNDADRGPPCAGLSAARLSKDGRPQPDGTFAELLATDENGETAYAAGIAYRANRSEAIPTAATERCSLRPGNVHSADGWRAGGDAL